MLVQTILLWELIKDNWYKFIVVNRRKTLTNCLRGPLGLIDVVIKIFGSLSLAFAYSSSIVDFGTKLKKSRRQCHSQNQNIM